VKLRVTCQPLLQAGHTDEHDANAASIEDVSNLIEARHLQAIGLIDDEESRRVFDLLTSSGVRPGDLHDGRVRLSEITETFMGSVSSTNEFCTCLFLFGE